MFDTKIGKNQIQIYFCLRWNWVLSPLSEFTDTCANRREKRPQKLVRPHNRSKRKRTQWERMKVIEKKRTTNPIQSLALKNPAHWNLTELKRETNQLCRRCEMSKKCGIENSGLIKPYCISLDSHANLFSPCLTHLPFVCLRPTNHQPKTSFARSQTHIDGYIWDRPKDANTCGRTRTRLVRKKEKKNHICDAWHWHSTENKQEKATKKR